MLTAFLSSPLHSTDSTLSPEERYKNILDNPKLRSTNFSRIKVALEESLHPIFRPLPENISNQIATIKDSIGEALKLAKKQPGLISNQNNAYDISILMCAAVINDANSVDDILGLIPSGDNYDKKWKELVHERIDTSGRSAYILTPYDSKLKACLESVEDYKNHLFWQKIISVIKWMAGLLCCAALCFGGYMFSSSNTPEDLEPTPTPNLDATK